MAYFNYSNESVFQNGNINSVCNAITEDLLNEFGEEVVNTSFGLTGSASKIFQNAMEKVPIRVVPFVTNNVLIFNYLSSNINRLMTVQNSTLFTNVIQIVNPNAYFEFWYLDYYIDFMEINTIYMQTIDAIPPNIL